MPRSYFLSIGMALAMLVGVELAARYLMGPLGDSWAYWNDAAKDKFEYYRATRETDAAPTILAIGDSTGARNFSPASFMNASGVARAYNLAWPANFPLALEVTTFPLLREENPPRYVLVFLGAHTFIDLPKVRRFEAGILSSPVMQRALNHPLPSDYLYVSRLYRGRKQLVDYWIKEKPPFSVPAELGFMPLEDEHDHERAEKNRLTNIAVLDVPLAEARLQVLEQLSQISKHQNIQVIIVIPAVSSPSFFPRAYQRYRHWLMANQTRLGFAVWDYFESPKVQASAFADEVHLLRDGADAFSIELGTRFRLEFLTPSVDF